jgi:hypothetical protein
MTAQEKMKEWFMICIVAAISLSMLGGFLSCLDIEAEKQRQWEKENPVDSAKERCYSKIRGSRPACWSEGDWEVFCERVQCKQQ